MAVGVDSYLLGIDLGAGSLKATVVDSAGRVAGAAAEPVTTFNRRPGWSEQDPAQWYEAMRRAVPRALAAARIGPRRLVGVGFSAGAHIGVLVDSRGRVLRDALMWNDQRAVEEARALHARAGELIVAQSLNQANATWLLPQLAWLARHEPEVTAAAHRLFLAKDYLRWRLCGSWHTDFSDVVGALMADAARRDWSPALCALIDWPLERLPPVVTPTTVVGEVTAAAAEDCGLAHGTPVVCGSNDTTVESWAAGAIAPGQAVVKLATAGVLYSVADHAAVHPPVSCYPHILPGLYYTATGTNACASAHRWLRDCMFLPAARAPERHEAGVEAFQSMDRLAAAVPPGAEGLLFHPYLQGERAPHWDPLLRGDFVGLTIGHGPGHFARALYEGVACSIRDLKLSAEALGLRFGTVRLVGGGARSALWRRILCDMLGLAIEQPREGDASYGAALLAGVGVGVFPSARAAVEACVEVVSRIEPDPVRSAFYAELHGLYREAQQALVGVNHRLHALAASAPDEGEAS